MNINSDDVYTSLIPDVIYEHYRRTHTVEARKPEQTMGSYPAALDLAAQMHNAI